MDLKTLLTSWYFVAVALLLMVAAASWPRSRRWCWSFLKNNSELLTIPTGLVLWGYSDNILRALDPTAGVFDAGVFQVILFAIIQLLVLHGFVRVFMKLQWPTAETHLDKVFSTEFQLITSWQRLKLSVSIFFLLLFALILLSRVIV